jgi:hypothetical protein
MTNWQYSRPVDGEAEMKEVERLNWRYCSHCGCWTTGDKMHVTDKHKTKEEMAAEGTSQGHPG